MNRKIAAVFGCSATGVLSGCLTYYVYTMEKWQKNWDKYVGFEKAFGVTFSVGILSGIIFSSFFLTITFIGLMLWKCMTESLKTYTSRRDPVSLTSPIRDVTNVEKGREYEQKLLQAEAKATRHILLIRHGQYHVEAAKSHQRTLTTLGQKQAHLTGQRLKELNLPYAKLTRSTLIRATQTAELIQKFLPDVPVTDCPLIEEGAPFKPEPYNQWPSEKKIYLDGPRIEHAFRKYIHRAPPEQTEDSYEIFVCHANVIRYFVCRALQLPENTWYRFRLHHGSITWLAVLPDGNVVMKEFGDAGFMPPDHLTIR